MKRTNEEVRKRSGIVKSSDMLVSFFYTLLRDELSAGIIEGIVTECVKTKGEEITFTNGWLANYAKDLASEFRKKDV